MIMSYLEIKWIALFHRDAESHLARRLHSCMTPAGLHARLLTGIQAATRAYRIQTTGSLSTLHSALQLDYQSLRGSDMVAQCANAFGNLSRSSSRIV